MNYIVYDLEWNNAPADIHSNSDIDICPNEIIEIGAVKISSDLCIVDHFDIFVKPSIYGSTIHSRISQITGITDVDVENGSSFVEAISKFKEWIGQEDYVLCTWGTGDLLELKTNCSYYKLDISWITEAMDIQRLMMDIIKAKNQISLENALEKLSIKTGDKFHRAVYDAIYTGKIFLATINMVDNLKKYYYSKGIYKPKLDVDLKKIKINKSKLRVKCPVCSRFIKTLDFIYSKNRYYKAFGYCDNCDVKIYHKTRITVYKDFEIDYESTNEILEKDAELKFKRRNGNKKSANNFVES